MTEESLYQKRIPIFHRSIKGTFRRVKSTVLVLAYAIFFLLPWIRWERPAGASQQAVHFDIPRRVYYIFDLVVDIESIFWLAGVLMIFAWTLFFVTGVLGRVFCGYFCFQTLWTDAFMKIETFIQGDRNKRMKLYHAPWNKEKVTKMVATWSVWLLFAFWSGFTFTAYWADAPSLLRDFLTGNAAYAAYFCTFLLTILTFIMAGFAREQVCTYMCPYGRFQSVMFDKDTLIISYDTERGENKLGRHKPIKEVKTHEQRLASGYGDCIDCDLCVQVCPTGIDIRNGLQYQCISCGLCIDACAQVMKKVGYPTGLIRYTSENALAGGKTRFFKFKSVGYATAIVLALSFSIYSIANRPVINYAVTQIRQPLMVELSDGSIQNRYEIKINNQTLLDQRVRIGIEGLPASSIHLDYEEIKVRPSSRLPVSVKVIQEAGFITKQREQHFNFKIMLQQPNGEIEYLLPASFFRQ